MTMRKFEKIRENILMIHAKDGKRIEKEIIELPGPNTYNPSYNLLEDSGFKVKFFLVNFIILLFIDIYIYICL